MGIDFLLRRAWKIILLALVVSAIGALITGLLLFLEGQATSALASMGSVQVLFIMPDNLVTVLSTIFTVKAAGTVYVAAMNFIDTKVKILS